jgi:hypothetical protein
LGGRKRKRKKEKEKHAARAEKRSHFPAFFVKFEQLSNAQRWILLGLGSNFVSIDAAEKLERCILHALLELRAQMSWQLVFLLTQNIQNFFIIGHNYAQEHFNKQKKHDEDKYHEQNGAENGVRFLERIVVEILQNGSKSSNQTLLKIPELKHLITESGLKCSDKAHVNAEEEDQKIRNIGR